MIRILTVLLLFFTNFQFAQKQYQFWNKIAHTPAQYCYFLYGSSDRDVWVYDKEANLHHWVNNNWNSFHPVLKPATEYFGYHFLTSKELLYYAVDANWRTHLFSYKNGYWVSAKPEIEVPMHGFFRINERVFIYGDWGRIYEYIDNEWQKISSPIKKHIFGAFNDSEGNIWLSTRGEGIYNYDGERFQKIQVHNESRVDVVAIFFTRDKNIYAATKNSDVLKYNGRQFVPEITYSQKEINLFIEKKFGFYTDNPLYELKQLSFPTEMGTVSYGECENGQVIALTVNREMFSDSYQSTNFFTDLTQKYRFGSFGNINPAGIALFHLNDDVLPEIVLLQPYRDSPFLFFKNNYNKPLEDISSQFRIPDLDRILSFNICDLNADNSPDIGLTTIRNNKVHLNELSFGTTGLNSINSYRLPVQNEFRSIMVNDVNNDGVLDYQLIFYLLNNQEKGGFYNLIRKNYSLSYDLDSSLTALSRSYLNHIIAADFNNDNKLDYYLLTSWSVNRLLLSSGGSYKNASSEIDDTVKSNSLAGAAFDYDNDGDNDILYLSEERGITLLANYNNGSFRNITRQKFKEEIFDRPSHNSRFCLSIGDVDNNGYKDILLISYSEQTYRTRLFINNSADGFIDQTKKMLHNGVNLQGAVLSDFDNDGDLDIIGYSASGCSLLINNLDDANYLKIILKGVVSNTEGLGAGIWIYEAGQLNNPSFLKGYAQSGSERSAGLNNRDPVLHFGVNGSKLYDIKVRFYGGRTVIIKNVTAGKTISINELAAVPAALYRFPLTTYKFLNDSKIQLYIIFFVAAMVFMFFSIRYGIGRFNWDIRLTAGLIFANLTLFWILLVMAMDSQFYIKYLVPAGVLIIGMSLPHIVSLYNEKKNRMNNDSPEVITEKLFHLLFAFSHGEWALKNLTSLKLFFENQSVAMNDQIRTRLNIRIETFMKMTAPNIDALVDTGYKAGLNNQLITRLKNDLSQLRSGLNKISFPDEKLSGLISSIKQSVQELKRYVFARYSCNPNEVIRQVISSLSEEICSKNCSVLFNKMHNGEIYALVLGYELADIIENSLRNSLRSFRGTEKKNRIEIMIFWKPPKVKIDITDNGCGIHPDNLERIFEQGFSGAESTGYGLYSARQILKKYGGRIFVKESFQWQGSTFTIELNEGVNNEPPSHN